MGVVEMVLDAWYRDDNAWILLMAVVSCVLSFIPVYVASNFTGNHHSYDFLDPNLREACMASLFVVLSPAVDSMLEFIPLLPPKGETDTKRRDVSHGKSMMTITLAEKSIFVVGVLCLSVLYPTFQNYDTELLVRISVSFLNCSTTLMVCAILCFLFRRSTSFVLWNTRIMVVLVCLSGIINSCTCLYDQNDSPSAPVNVLFFVSNVLFDVAALVYVVSCFHSLFLWFKRLYGKNRNVVDDVNGVVEEGMDAATKPDKEKPKVITMDESITQLVVGTHMFSTFVVMMVNAIAIWYSASLTVYQFSIIIYIVILTAIVVFVMDSFAKRHVTATALCALLDAKTDYVRYISHEIRTPLSATLMGLRLMLNDFKKSMPRPGTVGDPPGPSLLY